jgi:cell wall-associated NlpC family hydrolase
VRTLHTTLTPVRNLAVLAVLLVALLGSLLAAAPSAAASTEQSLGEAVVATAATHAGKPYRYGRVGPDAFDCSGFVLHVFRQHGRELPRTSRDQQRATTPVAKDAKQVGDLIFMQNKRGRVTHVGIFAGGNDWWVAPRKGSTVRKQALYSSRYVVGRVA